MTPTKLYQQKINANQLQEDHVQKEVVEKLDVLCSNLQDSPKGIYMFGEVGRGKSMLMDILFETAKIENKRRVHFHKFMEELHERMHHLKPTPGTDPMTTVATEIAKDAKLLCFDEFYITNIADAMMLGRLFDCLFKQKITVCATSNWHPENLFKDGFNRHRFKPFINAILNNMDVVNLGEGRDWRLKNGESIHRYYIGLNEKSNVELEEVFDREAQGEKIETGSVVIEKDDIKTVMHSSSSVWFKFENLCNDNLGREHYLELTKKYKTIFLSNIPQFDEKAADSAIRFVTLIDILYENKTKFYCSAEVEPNKLCPKGDAAFAFKRTVSRLIEMQNF